MSGAYVCVCGMCAYWRPRCNNENKMSVIDIKIASREARRKDMWRIHSQITQTR